MHCSGNVVSTTTSQQDGPGFDSQTGQEAFLCGVCMFFPCLHRFLQVSVRLVHGGGAVTSKLFLTGFAQKRGNMEAAGAEKGGPRSRRLSVSAAEMVNFLSAMITCMI